MLLRKPHSYPFCCFLLVVWCLIEVVKGQINGSDHTKIYATYYPQFHKDSLTEQLMGQNHTDWEHIRRSPEFNRLGKKIAYPSELGFYDLLDVTTRRKQKLLAQEYKVDGFIYYHYWFHHHGEGAVLAGALEKLLIDGEPHLPFALSWAKESWVQVSHDKDSSSKNILKKQSIPEAKNALVKQHYDYLRKFFHTPLYIKVNGVPLFPIYGGDTYSPAMLAIISRMKELAVQDGFPTPGLHIPLYRPMQRFKPYPPAPIEPTMTKYYDSVWNFPFPGPHSSQLKVPYACKSLQKEVGQSKNPPRFPAAVGTIVSFDSTPRAGLDDAYIIDRTFGGAYRHEQSLEMDIVSSLLFSRCCQMEQHRNSGGDFIILNSWNGWVDGMVLEPSAKYGRTLLKAVRRAKNIAAVLECDWKQYDLYMRDSSKFRLSKVRQTVDTSTASVGTSSTSASPAASVSVSVPQRAFNSNVSNRSGGDKSEMSMNKRKDSGRVNGDANGGNVKHKGAATTTTSKTPKDYKDSSSETKKSKEQTQKKKRKKKKTKSEMTEKEIMASYLYMDVEESYTDGDGDSAEELDNVDPNSEVSIASVSRNSRSPIRQQQQQQPRQPLGTGTLISSRKSVAEARVVAAHTGKDEENPHAGVDLAQFLKSIKKTS